MVMIKVNDQKEISRVFLVILSIVEDSTRLVTNDSRKSTSLVIKVVPISCEEV